MTTWRAAKEKLHAENLQLKDEYERLGPRFAALSKLIDARERMKISQSEVARRMDVPPNVVSRLESAQHSPRLDTMIAYAKALGLELDIALRKSRAVATGTRSTSATKRRTQPMARG